MANLPTHLTDKKIADLPWENDAKGNIPPRLEVTGHSGNDITTFRDALYTAKIPTKEIVENGKTYVQAATDVPGVEKHLATIRLRHLTLVNDEGVVVSYKQFDSNEHLKRADKLFTDLRPDAVAGTRAENPAAMESLKNVFHQYGYFGNEIKNGELKVLASGPNADFLHDIGAIKGQYTFKEKPLIAELGSEPAIETSVKNPAITTSLQEAQLKEYYRKISDEEQLKSVEKSSLKTITESVVNNNRHTPGLMGALILTADAAIAAKPALDKGEYAEAATLALNSTSRLATQIAVATECTIEVATAAAPLSTEPRVYAATAALGAAICYTGMNETISLGDKAIAVIQERVKEVAADNGLDPDHIWSSMLQKAKEAPAAPIETQQEYER